MTTLQKARSLDEKLVASWSKFSQDLTNFVEAEAWVPLGFTSLAAYLRERNFTLVAVEHKVELVYTLIDQGASNEDIAHAVPGASEWTAEGIRHQKETGLPPGDAAFRPPRRPTDDVVGVGAHYRNRPSAIRRCHADLGVGEYVECSRIALAEGMTMPQWVRKAVLVAKDAHLGASV